MVEAHDGFSQNKLDVFPPPVEAHEMHLYNVMISTFCLKLSDVKHLL